MTFWDKYQLYVYVAVVALLSWWLLQIYDRRDVEIRVAKNSPDFFSTGYYKKEMNIEGLPKNELVANKMQHFKADGNTYLEQAAMTLFNPGAAPWVIKADKAVMASDGDNLNLLGNNLITRDAFQKNAALSINTSNLKVKLSTHFARTDDWAEIISPPNKSSGTGMEATFVSPIHLKLLSKVKGRYEIK